MSDHIGKSPSEHDRDSRARAPRDPSEQSDPELATRRARHRQIGLLVAIGLPLQLGGGLSC
jgi:hypothetical protein